MKNQENGSAVTVIGVMGAIALAVALIHLGAVLTTVSADLPWNPIALSIGLMRGTPWPPAASWLLGVEALLVIVALGWWGTRTPSRTSSAARRMSPGGKMRPAMEEARLTEAERLHPDAEGIGRA